MRSKKIIKISNFSNENDSKISSYNISTKNGINTSLGIDDAKFPFSIEDMDERRLKVTELELDSVEGVTCFKQFFSSTNTNVYRMLLHGSDHKSYLTQFMGYTDELFYALNLTFSSPPVALSFKQNNEDSIILASDDAMKIWKTNYQPYEISNTPIISSMCINDGVLFCTIKKPAFKIWYATDFNAENIGSISSNSGYVSLEDELGDATKILTFKEDVYVIREYGITKLNYVKKDISFTQIYSSNTRIIPNTVCVSGNLMLFMTNEGIYSFNGTKVNKLNIKIQSLLPQTNKNAVASSLGSKYYLGLHLNFDDGDAVLCENDDYVNNALIILDVNDLSFDVIRGIDIKTLCPAKTDYFEKMLLTFNGVYKNRLGEISKDSVCFDEKLPKKCKISEIFNDSSEKIITKLEINASKGIYITMNIDGKQYQFLTFREGKNEFNFKVFGKNMSLSIDSQDSSMWVKNLSIEYYEG